MARSVLISIVACLLVGCVGSPFHSTRKYNSIQSSLERNNDRLLRMSIGMTQEDTLKVMGKPERSEGYEWGSAWLYRTAMTSGIYGTADSDFTPIVFDDQGVVIGWGRNFFVKHRKRYELDVRVR